MLSEAERKELTRLLSKCATKIELVRTYGVAQFFVEHGRMPKPVGQCGRFKLYDVDAVFKAWHKYGNSEFKQWTTEEERKLIAWKKEGKKYSQIAGNLDRTESSVRCKWSMIKDSEKLIIYPRKSLS